MHFGTRPIPLLERAALTATDEKWKAYLHTRMSWVSTAYSI